MTELAQSLYSVLHPPPSIKSTHKQIITTRLLPTNYYPLITYRKIRFSPYLRPLDHEPVQSIQINLSKEKIP